MFKVSCVNMVLVVFMMVSGGDSMLVYNQLWMINMLLCVDICIRSVLQDTLFDDTTIQLFVYWAGEVQSEDSIL